MTGIKSEKCARGHLMQPPNLYLRRDGQRQCRACQKIYQANMLKRRKGKERFLAPPVNPTKEGKRKRRKILKMILAGKSCGYIARTVGCSPQYVCQVSKSEKAPLTARLDKKSMSMLGH